MFSQKRVGTIIYTLILMGIFMFPAGASADYVFKGKSFKTYSEYTNYVSAYMQAWRIAHGKATGSNSSTQRTYSDDYFSISTGFSKDISKESVRLSGNLTFEDSLSVRIWFDYGKNKYNLTERTETEVLDDSSNSQKFDSKIVGLDDDTTYYYRAGGIDNNRKVRFGNIRSFKTDVDTRNSDAKITARTSRAKGIDEDRANLKATLSYKREEFAYVWFQYGEDEDSLDEETSKVVAYKVDGKYVTKTIKRLDEDTTYFFRAVGEDQYGERSYGKIFSFETSKDIKNQRPEVTTEKADDVKLHSAILGGTIDMNDFRNGVAFLIYGEDKEDIEDAIEKYSRYKQIRERGDNLQKILLDDDFNRYKSFFTEIKYLDLDTKHYFTVGVEFENEEEDDEIIFGRIYSFKTKRT